MDKHKVLFIGSGDFAVPVLEGLLAEPSVEVCGVVTQPDKPAGRRQIMTSSPVKHLVDNAGDSGSEHVVPAVFQPEKLRLTAEEILQRTKPGIVIVCDYGQMIPDSMLNQPQYGCLNIHGSLLPLLRGAVPVQMAILQGFSTTGVTIQKMVAELDAGPILAAKEEPILEDDTTAMLMDRLAAIGRDLLLEILPGWFSGEIIAQEQDHQQATFCYQKDIAKDNAQLEWTMSTELAERMIRAFNPWPIAWFETEHAGQMKRVKVFKGQVVEDLDILGKLKDLAVAGNMEMLQIYRIGKRLFLPLQDGVLELQQLQLAGKRVGTAVDYLFLGKR